MASPTRDEFLGYVHQPRRNRDGDPLPGSPTKSTTRYRWRELRGWDVERDATAYLADLPDADKTQTLDVPPAFWSTIEHLLRISGRHLTAEATLKVPFSNAFRDPLNTAIEGASDAHAEMWSEGSRLAKEPVGNADFIMVYEGKLTGLVELKTWWNVTNAEIDDVRAGREPLQGAHHGRLAIEQTYGYLVFDKVLYGIMTTFNSFVFLKRESPGILYMSRTIPIDSPSPTILKLLYFFSHLCATHTDEYPELNAEGSAVYLRPADKSTTRAPKIPDPTYLPPPSRGPPVAEGGSPRRSPRFQEPVDDQISPTRMDITDLVFLGCKGWRGTLNDGSTVFAKLWDGWKLPASHSEHEANVYAHMRDLWGTVVPEFIGLGDWGFCHILLLSYIESPMLYQVAYTPAIAHNILKAFQQLHARKICHGDVRPENILVRKDNSVVIIDFERSEIDTPREVLDCEMREVRLLVAELKARGGGGQGARGGGVKGVASRS